MLAGADRRWGWVGAEVGIDDWPLSFQVFLYLLALPVCLLVSLVSVPRGDLNRQALFSESYRFFICLNRQNGLLLDKELKISLHLKALPRFGPLEQRVLMQLSSNTSVCGSQIPLTMMHIRAGRDKNCAFAFNPLFTVLLLSLTPVAWGVKILYGKEGSSLASSLLGFTEHEELLGWLTALKTQLPGSIPPSSLLERRDTQKQRGNQVGLLIFINQVVNLLHVMKAKHQYC